MKRITLSLTDEEHAELERRAAQERRTPREMAAYLVTKSQPWPFAPDWTYRPEIGTFPYRPVPTITTDRTYDINRRCVCGQIGWHLCASGNFSITSSAN